MTPDPVNVLIGSGGRRNYLVNWFREALQIVGLEGTINVIDSSPAAPALVDADRAAVVPEFASNDYFPAVLKVCEAWDITLAFSLNDFESSLWASTARSPFGRRDLGIELIAASQAFQSWVEDKAAYQATMAAAGLQSPLTVVGTVAATLDALPWDGESVVIKDRYGSGSSGLQGCSRAEWRERLEVVARGARDRMGRRVSGLEHGLAHVVVQRGVEGTEYGLDLVNDFEGGHRAVLARRKLRMRSGETDQATTVDAGTFQKLAGALTSITRHRGLIDVDVIVPPDGDPYVIDVNPRFGGGYPFSHVAGANVPAAYLAWHSGASFDPGWLNYAQGVTASKTEDIRLAEPAPWVVREAN